MSNDRECIGRLKLKMRNEQKAKSILSVWRGSNGGYSITKDKDSEKYPAIGLFDALKAWGMGEAFIDYWPADPGRGARTNAQTLDGPRAGGGDFGTEDPFDDSGLPF
jgi:hypothetical protein